MDQKIREELIRQFEAQRLQEAEQELRIAVRRHFNNVAEDILTMKCPNCHTAFNGEIV